MADRYADVALVVRSLKYNLGIKSGPEMVQLFFEAYGLEQVDEQKIAYYILLDELF